MLPTALTPDPMQTNPWIACPQPNPDAKLRLFCLPFAGGGTLSFRAWSADLPHVELCPIQLPGRERRLTEAPYNRIEPLIQALTEAILPALDRPYALFGHSMGGLIAFELVRSLRRSHQPQPSHLFVSGCRPPQVPDVNPPIHALPDAEFVQQLRRYNGTPEAVLTHPELMALLLPTLRADFAIVENYVYSPEPPLNCPITLFGGLQDTIVAPQSLPSWQVQTAVDFSQHFLPGDHFFLHSNRSLLLQLVGGQLFSVVF
jgi:medium-chain acyl-[acyl-carrier-protein] hydrolase